MKLAPGQTGLLRANASIRGEALRKWRAIGQFFEGLETFPIYLKGPRLHDYRLRLREKCCQRSIVLNKNNAFC
jgi:hypothetical protein